MVLSFAIAITSFINAVFSLLLKGGENTIRTFCVSLCFATAGIVFKKTIERQNR